MPINILKLLSLNIKKIIKVVITRLNLNIQYCQNLMY